MAYLIESDLYECDIRGFAEKWDAHDDYRGDMWECENCGKHFCTKCFTTKSGRILFDEMMSKTDIVYCPDCYREMRGDLLGGETYGTDRSGLGG